MRNFIAIFVAAAAALLAGCTKPTNTSFIGPSGATVNKTKCSGSPDKCFQSATKTCGGSYSVRDSESHAGGALADLLPGPVTWYGMSYICGPSNGLYPKFPFRGVRYQPPVYQPPVYKPPVQTNCRRYGNSVNCTTY